jgi:hypothetical protein
MGLFQGSRLIRTIWFAAICLAGICGLLAAKFTPVASAAEESVLDPAPIAVGLAAGLGDDTLTKSDKLIIAYVLPSEIAPESPTESIRREDPADNAKAPSESLAQPLAQSLAQPLARPLAVSHLDRRSVVMLPKPRPKIRLAKISHPPKPIVEAKTCSQPDSLGSLLLSFSGQPNCG